MLVAAGCGRDRGDPAPVAPQAALALPTAVIDPADNLTSTAKVELGRLLFWDPVLSGDRDVACATCHHPAFAYTDGRALSIGVGGTGVGPARVAGSPVHGTKRNAMTVLDTAFNGATIGSMAAAAEAPMFWDDRASALEGQARGPITALDEMRGTSFDETTIFPELVRRLRENPEYVARFEAAFGPDAIAEDSIVRAIAAFERTLIDHGSSYDRYMDGDATAMNASQQRGLAVFTENGCARCHSGPMLSDYRLHSIGVPDPSGLPADPGQAKGFRTASLRNVTRTAPYMHGGVFATLDDVFRFYHRVDRRRDPALDDLRAPEREDADDVKAFLGAVSDGTFDATIPTSVPSGLTPGGR
jgi:cytochrome c peroxidase